MRAELRLLTAVAMIGICGILVTQGFRIVQFSLGMANIESLEKQGEIINVRTAAPGVASTALQAELRKATHIDDRTAAHRRLKVLSAILSIKPLSSIDWLMLSGMQLVTNQPMEQVLGSLKLSILTGPNEGYVMVERGIFGVPLWDILTPELTHRVAVDLTAERAIDTERLQAVLAAEPDGVRNELRAAMLATGLAPKDVERRLGF
jgi:hypothetical protein